MLMLMLMRDGCHASVGRSIVRIEIEKRPARSRLYCTSLLQADAGRGAGRSARFWTFGGCSVIRYLLFFCSFIYLFYFYFYCYSRFLLLPCFLTFFFLFFIVESLSMNIAVIGLG
ncbi:hypothetical protein ASPVEDRAFT_531819 [Aspergillus versicolor CBS 583.65]|uniref:Uncharacterized protein n=1 Tax=Aspergillus versicolor CBS 583.65 TaxID=1036611 RepID=A0A1L9PEP9_ASPVE|nr:uncharacterized protein ASPVEDRAFT_531819 [Aspergillus versicolor CBS 583.65]OJI99914.1 hypothetical protein ASPVEDRAFT_531819 [Aspergillus versicolor CBS 583.65]